MAYTNSPLVSYTKLSPNHSGQRTHSIDRITPHCVVGQCSVETLGNVFLPTSRQASSNYGIGVDGRVGMYVEEKNRSWCSSSASNDQRAVTIECASDSKAPYAFKDVVYQRLIELCTDICKRNGKTKLLWLGDKSKTLNYCTTFQTKGKSECAAKRIPEETLDALTCEVLGVTHFDPDTVRSKITAIRAENNNVVVFCMDDGSEIVKRWADHSRAESWTPEMKEQARQRALQARRSKK